MDTKIMRNYIIKLKAADAMDYIRRLPQGGTLEFALTNTNYPEGEDNIPFNQLFSCDNENDFEVWYYVRRVTILEYATDVYLCDYAGGGRAHLLCTEIDDPEECQDKYWESCWHDIQSIEGTSQDYLYMIVKDIDEEACSPYYVKTFTAMRDVITKNGALKFLSELSSDPTDVIQALSHLYVQVLAASSTYPRQYAWLQDYLSNTIKMVVVAERYLRTKSASALSVADEEMKRVKDNLLNDLKQACSEIVKMSE